MKSYIKTVLIVCLSTFIVSCQNTIVENTSTSETADEEFDCFNEDICKYNERVKLFLEILCEDSIIQDNKNSIGECYLLLKDDPKLDTMELSQGHKDKVSRIDLGIGFMPPIINCAQIVKDQNVLSQKQEDFYSVFQAYGENGFFDFEKIGNSILKMSIEEYELNGIRDLSIYFLGYCFLTKYYQKVPYLEDPECFGTTYNGTPP